MKISHLAPLLAVVLGVHAHAADGPCPTMRDAATHEQLAATYRKTAALDPMLKLEPATGADPSKATPPQDLISQSDIICYGGRATLVPKRAVLHIPAAMAERLKFQPGSAIVSWAEFQALNRGWIATVEVTRPQAEGNDKLDEDLSKRIGDSANLVVAVFRGGPISVLPLKDPAPVEEIPAVANQAQQTNPAPTSVKP